MTYQRREVIGNATPVTAIYALCEMDDTPRYVGKTVQYLHQRHKAHIRAARAGKRLPVHYWLRKRIARGDGLTIRLLEYVYGHEWPAREKHWIARFRQEGHNLLNLTDGGEGLAGHKFTQEHRNKIAAALRTGAHRSCLVCGTVFWRKLKDIKRGYDKFCSRECSNRRVR